MNREDLNWRKLNLQTAVKTINQMPDCQSAKAFVLDDSIKIRHGKKRLNSYCFEVNQRLMLVVQ
jgi:hypothetical protein